VRKIALFLAMVLGAPVALAQTSVNGRIMEGALATRPVTCANSDVFIANDQDPPLNFQCGSSNNWIAFGGSSGGGSPGGFNQMIQYNCSGSFCGDANFTWDFTNKALNIAGNINQKGPAPSVNVMAFGCTGTGNIHDDTACIQAAINYACANNRAIIEFPPPPQYYSVTQTQTGTSATQPIFYGCGGPANPALTDMVLKGANGLTNRPQFSYNGDAIVALRGASPNPAPVFLLSAGNMIRDLNIYGRNIAVMVGNGVVSSANNRIEDSNLVVQESGLPTTTLPNSPLVIYDSLWFWMTGGSLQHITVNGPTITLLQDGGQTDGLLYFTDIVAVGGGTEAKQILANQSPTAGNWVFRNFTNELLSTPFLFFDDDGSHHWSIILNITLDHSGTSDGTPPSTISLNSAGMQIRGITLNENSIGSNTTTPAIQAFAGTVSDVFITGNNQATKIVDGSGNLLGYGLANNGNGWDYFTGNTALDETFIDSNASVLGPPTRVFAAGNTQASIGFSQNGFLFNNGVANGFSGQLIQTTQETVDVGFAKYLPPTGVATVPTTGGSIAPGTYHYFVVAADSGSANTFSAYSTIVPVTLGGANNAVTVNWTPSATSVATPGGYFVVQQESNHYLFIAGAGSNTATDLGTGVSCCYGKPNVNSLAQAHRFTATSLGINTLSPTYNLDVNGTGHHAQYVDFTEIAAPANPPAGIERVWADNSTHLFTCKTSSGAACSSGGGGGGGSFQVNGVGVISSTTINFQNSAVFNGLTFTFTNPSAGNVQLGASGVLTIAGGGTGAGTQQAAFDALSPNTTLGDIIIYNGTHNVRLPIGITNGMVLTVSAGTAVWVTPSTVTGSGASAQCAFWSGAGSITGSANCLYSATSGISLIQGANAADMIYGKRATDSSPTGNFWHFQNAAANSDIATLDVNGNLSIAQQLTTGTGAANHFVKIPEGTTAGAGTGFDVLSADATTHSLQVSNNNLGFSAVALFASNTLVAHSVMITNATFPLLTQATPGPAGQCFVSNGASADPSFQGCVGSVNFNNLLPALAANTPINNANFPQQWNWSLTTASTIGLHISESSASTATGSVLFYVNTLAGSTLSPFTVTAGGAANGIQMNTSGVLGAVGTGGINATLCNSATCVGTATGTANAIPKYTGAAAIGNSLLSDNGTTLTYTGVGGISFTSANASISDTEGAAPAGSAGVDILWGDSTAHAWKFIVNNGSAQIIPAAQTCTNQVVTATTAAGGTCTTLTSSFVNTTIAITGVDINTSSQVTATHITGFTVNTITKFNATGNQVNAAMVDNGTLFTVSEPFDMTTKPIEIDIANDGTTGTTTSGLAKLTSTGLINALTTDTSIPVYIVESGGGVGGTAQIVQPGGQGDCRFDHSDTNTEGWFVIASVTIGTDCHAQLAQPAAGIFISGQLVSNATTAGATAKVAVLNTFSAIGSNTVCSPTGFGALTDAATVTWALGSGLCANASLTFTVHGGSRTLNITGPANGGSYVLFIQQDATGGEGLTLGTGCTWKVSGGGGGAISPSTSANAVDVLSFTVTAGGSCLANFNKNFN
jgi:hypothetical protein